MNGEMGGWLLSRLVFQRLAGGLVVVICYLRHPCKRGPAT